MKPASHVVLTSLCVLSSTATLAACGKSGSDNPEVIDQAPFRDDWKVEHEGDFDVLDDENLPRILSIDIGTPDPFGDNFLNRGDVIVDFTGEDGKIKIELRRFTFASDEDAAEEEVFEKIDLWAYNASIGTPKRPEDMEPDADCTDDNEAWLDGCGIYIYYDGQSQLERAGADIRVTLPSDYRQDLNILTSDNLIEDTYPNHGNVCVNNLNAHADITLENGVALVKMAADATPAPKCDEVGINDCTNVDEPTTTAAMDGLWSRDCICANMLKMGAVSIEAEAPYAADITVDAPRDLWASITAENEAGNMGEDVCPVSVMDYGEDFVPDEMQFDPNEPWRLIGDANRPSDAALAGGGFAIKLTSSACAPVASVESPREWEPDTEPEAEIRGNLKVCSGCLDENLCDDLPGEGD